MAAQFNQNKAAAKVLFQQLIFSPNLAYLAMMTEKSGIIHDWCLVNRLEGAVSGNPTYTKAIGPCWGLDFDGTGDFVTLGNVPALDFERTEAFSGLCVINPNVSAIGSIISKRLSTGTLRGWDWHLTAGRVPALILQNAVGNRIEVRANAAIANGTATMLGFTYSGSSAASGVLLYDNGAPVADTDTENTLSATMVAAGLASIGARNASDQQMNGDVGCLALWDGRAVSAQEVRLYASLAGFL